MKKTFILMFLFASIIATAQEGSNDKKPLNSGGHLLESSSPLTIGGYAEIDYNQTIEKDIYNNGKLDVHRMVLLFGYKFSDRVKFISEVEFEHVSELYVEQAFLDIKLSNSMSLRSGLLLIPVGLINEYHEPVTFNGVERTYIDSYIVPSTWREIGIGIAGTVWDINTNYQLYVVNGFNGYNGAGTLDGKNGFRKGRQKGAESIITTPGISGKAEYFGLTGLTASFSGYYGKTSSSLFKGLDKTDDLLMAQADSSVVGLALGAADFKYNKGGLTLKGQLYYASISNSEEYNALTGKDLGSRMLGWYLEAGFNLLRFSEGTEAELIPFVRVEKADTHLSTDGSLAVNPSYEKNILTTGITFKPVSGAALKSDFQIFRDGNDAVVRYFNMGVSVWF